MTPPTSTWLTSTLYVDGADAGNRARVREVLRGQRVLALTNDAEGLEIALATDPAGRVAVVGEDGRPVSGASLDELGASVAAAAPGQDVIRIEASGEIEYLTTDEGESLAGGGGGAAPSGCPVAHGGSGEGALDAGGVDAEPEGWEGEEVFCSSVSLTDASVEELLLQCLDFGPVHVLPMDSWVAVLREDPVFFDDGEHVALRVVTTPDGLDVSLSTPGGTRIWTPGHLRPLSLPEVDVHEGPLAQFLDRYVGLGALVHDVAREIPHLVPEQLRDALQTPGDRGIDKTVAALGLPAEVGAMLRREITPEAVPGVSRLAPTNVLDAAVDTVAWDVADSERGGLLGLYRTMTVDKPWIMQAYSAAMAGGGALLTSRALRKAARGDNGKGVAVQGLFGGLMLIEAAGELWLQKKMRGRVEKLNRR